MSNFVDFRKVQDDYREQNKVKFRMPRFHGFPCVLDNGEKARIDAVYEDGRVRTTSGDIYDGVKSNGHQLHVVNREPAPFCNMSSFQRLRSMGFGKKDLDIRD